MLSELRYSYLIHKQLEGIPTILCINDKLYELHKEAINMMFEDKKMNIQFQFTKSKGYSWQ
jgi:hypothetical protein